MMSGKLSGEKNMYYVCNLSMSLKKLPDNLFEKFELTNKKHAHHCFDVEICFTDQTTKNNKTTIMYKYRKNISHVHFWKTYVTIDRAVFDGQYKNPSWSNYTMSKLEFVLRFPELMKRMEELKK